MRLTSETTADGITQQHFFIEHSFIEHGSIEQSLLDAPDGSAGDVPGVLWTPAGAVGPRPLVLLGHGGGAQHKATPGHLERARRYVIECGFAVAAIDAPGHGERPADDGVERMRAPFAEARATGRSIVPLIADFNAAMARRVVPEWRATLDALAKLEYVGAGPVGYRGASMGAGVGIPFVADEPRITAAVFGLTGEALAATAARITVPVEFVLQWDDELVPRESGLALFDAFASAEKTLHANPGLHGQTPAFEIDSEIRFFARHLTD